MKPAGAIIVAYNSEGCIDACLRSVMRYCDPVIVVDNASADETVTRVLRHSGVRLIGSDHNLGFAGGVNRGMAELQSELVLVLNPDVELSGDPQALWAVFEDPQAGAAAGILTGTDGIPQSGFSVRRFPTAATLIFECLGLNRLWPGNPVNQRYRCARLNLAARQDVEQPAGAFLAIRRSAWADVRGFDEGFYPVWFEDVDFLIRLHEKGYRVVLEPAVRARHSGGHSVGALNRKIRQTYWYGSLLRYAEKHFSPLESRLVALAILLGTCGRVITESLSARSFPNGEYDPVFRLARRGLLAPQRMADKVRGEQARTISNEGLKNSQLHG